MAMEQVGYQWGTIGAAGTTVITANPANLVGVLFGGTYVGTVTFTDAAVGTATSPNIITFNNPATSVPGFIPISARCRFGIVAVATGTPVMTYLWDGL